MVKTVTATKPALLDTFKQIVGNDVAMLFGDTGSGKTRICHSLALETIGNAGRVIYLDTERNLSGKQLEGLGPAYFYTPVFEEIKQRIRSLPPADLAVIDSVGMPILIQYSRMNMRDRLYAFLEMASMLGELKDWTYRNKALAVVTNQPVSEFEPDPKKADEPRDPFGGKSKFVAKEIWQTSMVSRDRKATRLLLTAFRSRELAFGTVIAELAVTDEGLQSQVKLDRVVSAELHKSLGDEILRATSVKELKEIGARINSLKHQLTEEQGKWLREAWATRRKELPDDEVIPTEQVEPPA